MGTCLKDTRSQREGALPLDKSGTTRASENNDSNGLQSTESVKDPCILTDINKQMGKKRQLFFTVESQLINAEGMVELDDPYLARINNGCPNKQ